MAPEPQPLIAFLTARLDEDAALATATSRGTPACYAWEAVPDVVSPGRQEVWTAGETPRRITKKQAEGDAAHIVRWDPARALAEVDAKRRMIEGTWGGPDHQDMWEHHMRLLALPYATHPDYRDEWRP